MIGDWSIMDASIFLFSSTLFSFISGFPPIYFRILDHHHTKFFKVISLTTSSIGWFRLCPRRLLWVDQRDNQLSHPQGPRRHPWRQNSHVYLIRPHIHLEKVHFAKVFRQNFLAWTKFYSLVINVVLKSTWALVWRGCLIVIDLNFESTQPTQEQHYLKFNFPLLTPEKKAKRK